MGKAEDALKRFEERNGGLPEEPVDADEADLVGEEMGVEPDSMDIPPGIVRGVLVYELEDGSFGYRSMIGEKLDIMDAISLGSRLVEGARSELHALKTIQLMKRSMAPAPAQGRVLKPRPMGRRPQ
jgi:hypothetical protein